MTNSNTLMASRQISVPFHGANLILVEHQGQPYTPMRPVVEGMGLDWSSQHRKLRSQDDHSGRGRFSTCVTEMVMQLPGDTQRRNVVCMALRKLPGWLMSIEPGKVKDPTVRARVIQYQNECDDVLWQYWNDGLAINPRMAFSVNPADVLTKDQQETLRLMVKTLVEQLPKQRQGGASIKVWSKLKAHFKVAYREIPQSEFTEAVSIVTRTAAEWEVVSPPSEYSRKLVIKDREGTHEIDASDSNLVSRSQLDAARRDIRFMRIALQDFSRRLNVLNGEESERLLDEPLEYCLRHH